jgi:hypothetical protein
MEISGGFARAERADPVAILGARLKSADPDIRDGHPSTRWVFLPEKAKF